jgi:hypothetical protein
MLQWLSSNLGRCPKCMRRSFQFAFASSLALALLLEVASGHRILTFAMVSVAVGSVGLWCAHLFVYAHRAARWTVESERSEIAVANDHAAPGRRRFIRFFFRALSYSATASIATVATADECRCPPQAPVCIFNPCRRESFCIPRGYVGCAGCAKSWYCNPGHNCLGDGSNGGRCS